jgi:serine/threonine protein kinase
MRGLRYGWAMQVMMHIAHKLEGLHEAGWVHRDLKPGNAIWLPSSNSWTLIDFGSAARIGTAPSDSRNPTEVTDNALTMHAKASASTATLLQFFFGETFWRNFWRNVLHSPGLDNVPRCVQQKAALQARRLRIRSL